MEAPVVHLSMIELEFKKRENPSRDTPIEKPLGAGSFMRCRVLHLNPTERNTYVAIPVPFVFGATAFLWKIMIDGNICCHLVEMFWEITEIAYYRSVYFQTQKIPKEKNQLKALKNQVSERERAEKVHIASALFLLFYLFSYLLFFLSANSECFH